MIREDPGLETPLVPDLSPPGEVLDPPLALATRGDSVYRVEGDTATLTRIAGTWHVRMAGRLVADSLELPGVRGVNAVVSPGFLRRECVSEDGTLGERWMTPPALPFVVGGWSGVGTPGPTLKLRLLPEAARIRYRVEGSTVFAVDDDDPERMAVCSMPGGVWAIGEAGGTGLPVSTLLPPGESALAIVSGSAPALKRGLNALPHARAHARRATEPADDVLRVRTGIPAIDDGVDWAATRVVRAVRRTAGSDWQPELWTALGAMAVGAAPPPSSPQDANPQVRFAGDEAGAGRWDPSALGLLLTAREALLTGRQGPAGTSADHLVSGDRSSLGGADSELARAALTSLADALRFGRPDGVLAALRELPGTSESGGRRLPMAGSIDPQHPIQALLAGGRAEVRTGAPALDDALSIWGLWASDPDAAWNRWRTRLAEGLAGGPAGPGTWDPAEGDADAPTAGALLGALAHGALGIAPDAPSGRLTLAPVLPGHLNRLTVGGLRVGDTLVEMRYEREGNRHTFQLTPETARVPLNVVLEPAIPGAGIERTSVDGQPAELDHESRRGRVRPRIQLPLDGVRTVEIVTT